MVVDERDLPQHAALVGRILLVGVPRRVEGGLRSEFADEQAVEANLCHVRAVRGDDEDAGLHGGDEVRERGGTGTGVGREVLAYLVVLAHEDLLPLGDEPGVLGGKVAEDDGSARSGNPGVLGAGAGRSPLPVAGRGAGDERASWKSRQSSSSLSRTRIVARSSWPAERRSRSTSPRAPARPHTPPRSQPQAVATVTWRERPFSSTINATQDASAPSKPAGVPPVDHS